jgi:hypothetical protein
MEFLLKVNIPTGDEMIMIQMISLLQQQEGDVGANG